jgi:hypothetical protein
MRAIGIPRPSLVGALAVAILSAACAGASSPSATQPAPSRGSTFTSAFYGYTVSLAVGWTSTAASTRWDGTGAPTSDNPSVDRFESGGTATAFAAGAPTTESLDTYVTRGIATNAQVHGDTCPAKPDSVEPVAVGGEAGTLVSWNCGILINAGFTVHGGTGYRFVFRDPAIASATDPADKATFTAILASVVFR